MNWILVSNVIFMYSLITKQQKILVKNGKCEHSQMHVKVRYLLVNSSLFQPMSSYLLLAENPTIKMVSLTFRQHITEKSNMKIHRKKTLIYCNFSISGSAYIFWYTYIFLHHNFIADLRDTG